MIFLALPILSAFATIAMAATTDVTTDADMESTVKALIDAGTCDDVSANDDCAASFDRIALVPGEDYQD